MDLELTLPEASASTPPSPLDLSAIPGAVLTAHRAWATSGGGALEVACVVARAPLWVDGLERELLSGATAMVASQRGLRVDVEPVAVRDAGFEQRFHAEDPAGRMVLGRHWAGFVGDEQLGACTLLCAVGEHDGCEAVVAGARSAVAFVAPPGPPAWLEALAWGIAHPAVGFALVVLALVVVGGLYVATRPRPTRGARGAPRRSG